MIRYFLVFTTLGSSLMYGHIEKLIDEKNIIEVAFSPTSHNRISVKDGHIVKIHGDGNTFSVNIDQVTGNAFVTMKKELEKDKSAVLTVVTDSGAIQDLLINSAGKLGEHLVLKESDEFQEDENAAKPEYFHKNTVDLFNTILSDKVPIGYGWRELSKKDDLVLPSPLSVKTIKAYEGPFEIIVVYKITNTGKKTVSISPELLKNKENSWVFLNIQQLDQNQESICLISYPKTGAV